MEMGDSYQYNLTIKLGSLLSLPAKFLHRLRRIDDVLSYDLDQHPSALDLAMPMTTFTQSGQISQAAMPPPARSSFAYDVISMPGPIAFMTSRYALGLCVMALLLNRIQHIVVPPRHTMALRMIRSRRSMFHALFYAIFPVNLSSTPTRIAFRIPSIFFLLKSLLLLFTIILQVAGMFPNMNVEVVQSLAAWASHKEMDDVCWSLFGTVCLSVLVEAITLGLEGPNAMNPSPFNIFGYSMLLHIYSLPMTHSVRTNPSRPDLNVLLTLFFPLLQASMIHVLGTRKKWSRHRLVPTAICSLASLLHFNIVLLTKPTSYPLLNYLPNLLETVLLLLTFLTAFLNVATQILLEGQVTRPLFGHAASLAPKWDEDFAIVLLRLGTASLEATNVAGLGNEVSSVVAGRTQDVDVRSAMAENNSIVELTAGGVKSITLPKARNGQAMRGFLHEIKTVKAETSAEEFGLVNHTQMRELAQFGRCVVDFLRGCFWLLMWVIWYKWRGMTLPRSRSQPMANTSTPPGPVVVTEVYHGDEDVYSRFVRGETLSDDEEDYDPNLEGEAERDESDQDDDSSESEEAEPDPKSIETANLYSDFLLDAASAMPGNPGPVLLAHMTAQSSLPLTRRRYGGLISQAHGQSSLSQSDWTSYVYERQYQAQSSTAARSNDTTTEGRMNCVVCTSEPREIICWPCRCLALCNDCRENLASRFPVSKHICPCCRRNVEGFSRIFIP